MNVPNLITIFRILLIPVLVVILLSRFEGKELAGFTVFLLASLTDLLDGLWARQRNAVTSLGQLLDPMADKLLISAALICLVSLGKVSAWMAIIIISREIFVTGLRAIASSRGSNIPSSSLGKFKMLCEVVVVGLLILDKKILGKFYLLSQLGLWVVMVVAIASAAGYFIQFNRAVLAKDS